MPRSERRIVQITIIWRIIGSVACNSSVCVSVTGSVQSGIRCGCRQAHPHRGTSTQKLHKSLNPPTVGFFQHGEVGCPFRRTNDRREFAGLGEGQCHEHSRNSSVSVLERTPSLTSSVFFRGSGRSFRLAFRVEGLSGFDHFADSGSYVEKPIRDASERAGVLVAAASQRAAIGPADGVAPDMASCVPIVLQFVCRRPSATQDFPRPIPGIGSRAFTCPACSMRRVDGCRRPA